MVKLRIEWHLGHVVQALRDQRRWTQPELAKRAGVDKATVVSVESMDRNHGRVTYEKIAGAFGLTMAEMFALIPESPHEETQRAAQSDTAASAGKQFRNGTNGTKS